MFSLTDVHSALLPAMLVEPLELGIDRGSLHGAVLMVDITGFTPLTVALTQEGPEGAETLSEMLRAAFTPLVSTVRSCGGSITGFAGDSFIAIFPDEHGAHEAAERTASQALPSHTTRAGTHHSLSVRVTLAAGPVRWGIASGAHQSTWFMRGTAIDHAARLQDAAIPGRLLHEPGLAPRPTRPSVWPSPERSALQAGRTQPAAVHGRLGRPEFREVVSVFLRLEPDLDDAAVVAVLTQVMDRTHAHRGYFNRADFGDKGSVCLLLFGAPLAFEDDVHNALCAVLSIRAAVAEHTRLAVGIARGRCFAGLVGSAQRAEYTALGPTTNLAARLMSAASWGEIRVATPLDAHPNHTFDPLPPSPYKGFANPILAARWTGRTEDRTAQDPERPVGRDQETLRIVRFIDHAAQHRRGGLCRVDGAPGMGKSLLVQAARAAVGADVLWLDGSADGQRMFLPFAHMVADADPSSLPERLQTALRWLKGDLDRSHPFHNGEPLVRFEQAQRALLALLVGAATGRTAVFAIDDAHLLDAGSAALLKRLLGAARAEPWVVLTAARPDDAGKPAVLPSVAGTRSDRQELGPLPPKALRLLMAALLGGNPTLHAAEQLHIQTQGNPLFAKQLLLFQRDTGTALPDATADIHRWRLSTAGSHVPTALRQLLVARLDRLELSLKEAAQAAAVVGHTFRTSLLATVIGRPVQGAVARGRRHDLWVHLSEDQHRFCSALLGDAAYALLPTRARLGLHRSAADALLAAHPGNAPGAHHRAICHHLRAAGDTEREQVHARLALVWATDRYANAEALDLTSRLLELAASDATERADLHLQRVTCAFRMERYDLVLQSLEVLEVLAPSLSPSQQLEIALWRYRRGRDLGLPDEVAHATEVGMRVAEASGDPLLIDKAAHMRVDLLRGQGHLEEAAARAEAAFRRLMAADAPHLAGPLAQMRAAIAVAAHQHEVAVAWCETAVAHLDPVRESQAWMMHAGSCQHLDRPQQARQSIERALAMASKHGDERQLIRIHTVAANLAAQSGDYPRAIAVYEEMLAAAELLAAKPVIAHVTYNCGLALHYCGRHEEGRRSTARTIAVYIELRMPLRLHRAQALHGLSHLFIGDSEEAWRLCQPGLEEPGTVTLAARVAGDAALRLDRPEDALRIGTVGLRAVEAGEHGYQGAFLALCAVARHRLGIADDLGAVEASLSVGWSNADPDPIAAHAWLAEVYRAHGNPRATRITLLARRILQRRAALLSDPAARAGFLSCSAAHRAFTAG